MGIDFTAVEDEVHRQVAAGTRPGIHVGVVRQGEVLLDLKAGSADPEAGRPVDADTLFYTFSAVKAVWSIATVQLADRGLIDLEAPVADYIPEFGQNGKATITVRQLLTHRAGLRDGRDDIPGGRMAWYYHTPLEQQIADIGASAPDWEPGSAHGYHGLTLQPLLCELITRVTGQAGGDYVRDNVFGPLGITDFHLGLPEAMEARVARLVDLTGGGYGPPPLIYNTPEMHAWPGGGFTTATEFAKFFSGVLDALSGRASHVLSADAARLATSIHVAGYPDRRLGQDVPWGLGLSIKPVWSTLEAFRATGRGFTAEAMFGSRATPGSFGHAGNIFGSTAFADPGRDIACVVMTNALLRLGPATESFLTLLDLVHDALDKSTT